MWRRRTEQFSLRLPAIALIAMALFVVLATGGDLMVPGFLGLIVGLVLFFVGSARDADQRGRMIELASLLEFEGRISSTEFVDQRSSFCRSLLELCRRHSLPFSVAVLKVPALTIVNGETSSVSPLNGRLESNFRLFKLSSLTEQGVRSSDVVICDGERRHIIVTCPVTDQDGAVVMCARLAAEVEAELGVTLMTATASYPLHGSTFETLVTAAVGGLTNDRPRVVQLPTAVVAATALAGDRSTAKNDNMVAAGVGGSERAGISPEPVRLHSMT